MWRGLAGWGGDADGLAGRAWNGPNWPCFGLVREWENNMVNSHWHSVHQSPPAGKAALAHVDSEHTANIHHTTGTHPSGTLASIGIWVDSQICFLTTSNYHSSVLISYSWKNVACSETCISPINNLLTVSTQYVNLGPPKSIPRLLFVACHCISACHSWKSTDVKNKMNDCLQ